MSHTAVVTGAAGFVGRAVCDGLLGDGWTVKGVDNFDPFYSRRIKERNLIGLRSHSRFSLSEIDIRDTSAVLEVLQGSDLVVHLAARAGVRDSMLDPAPYLGINVAGTTNLLETVRRAGIGKLVFASSSSVYGAAPLPFSEGWQALAPRSPYAESKRICEGLCRRYSERYGFRIAALRLFSVYGPGQRPDQAIHRFTDLVAQGKPVTRYGGGTTGRDYTYVKDVAAAMLLAVQWVGRSGSAYGTFNVGTGRVVTLDRVIELVGSALGAAPVVSPEPARAGDVATTQADTRKAWRELGFRSTVSVEAGIPEFINWFEVAHGRQSRTAS